MRYHKRDHPRGFRHAYQPHRALHPHPRARRTHSRQHRFPPAQDYYSGDIDLSAHLIHDKTSTFIVRASGHSMTGAGISDGDELIVDRAFTPRDGDVVIAILDDELAVKRLRITATEVILQAENPSHPSIRVGELSELRIWGVVTCCLHHMPGR